MDALPRMYLPALAAATFLLAASALASPFTGTWVSDLDTQSGLGKDVYLLANGNYSCESCTPPRHYAADGQLRRIVGDPAVESESVTVTGPRTIVTRIVEPAMTRTTTMTVSADNQTATYISIDHRTGIKQPLKTVYLARRVAAAPPGAHPVSGTWQGVAYKEVPELLRTTELRDTRTTFTYSVPIGASYTARIGDGFVPVHSLNAEGMKASVKRAGARKILETRTLNGNVILVRTFELSMDGKALTTSSENPQTGYTYRITAHRKAIR